MIKVTENEEKVTPKKLTINCKDVMVRNGMLTDEDGVDIAAEIEDALPDYVDTFSFKITVELE